MAFTLQPRSLRTGAIVLVALGAVALGGCTEDAQESANSLVDRAQDQANDLSSYLDDVAADTKDKASTWRDDLDATASSVVERLKTDTGDPDDMNRVGKAVSAIIPDVTGYEVTDGQAGVAFTLKGGTYDDRFCAAARRFVDDPSAVTFNDGSDHTC